jgi:hypothetical protein
MTRISVYIRREFKSARDAMRHYMRLRLLVIVYFSRKLVCARITSINSTIESWQHSQYGQARSMSF